MLRTLFFFVTFLPLTLAVILAGLPASFFSPDHMHNCGRFWGRISLRLAGVRLQVTGREHLPATGPAIYMANHQSHFDIPALFAGIPGQFRWLAKAELFRIPLFGLAMRRCGYIPVNRQDRKEAIRSMDQAAARITAGASVVVFPEGTRSPHRQLLPLKKGGFILALKSGAPIVPVAIHGTGRILPKGSRRMQGGAIHIEFLPPVATADLGLADRDQLLTRVEKRLQEALGTKEESLTMSSNTHDGAPS